MKYISVIFMTLISFSGISAMMSDHKMVNYRKKWKYTDYFIIPTIGIGSLFAFKSVRQDRFCLAALGLTAILHIDMFCRDLYKYDEVSWHEKVVQKIDLEKDKSLQINNIKDIKKSKKYESTYSRADERDYRISENGSGPLDFIYNDIE